MKRRYFHFVRTFTFSIVTVYCAIQVRVGHADATGAKVGETTAFYYGASVPVELATAYDQLVVEPEQVKQPSVIARYGAAPVAYLSVGEVAKSSRQAERIDRAWRLADNPAWASWVMDLRASQYREWLLDRANLLWAAGYRRFFLDTLDSYQLAVKSESEREAMRQALCRLIRDLARQHPGARILLNRGFELLPEIADVVHAVAAESLFDRYENKTRRYSAVPEADRAWLLDRLREVRRRYGLPVIVIDYRPVTQREQALSTARKIAALGFMPWVSDGTLCTVGIGPIEILPRRVLILTNEKAAGKSEALPTAMRVLAPLLEYLGYVPEYRDLTDIRWRQIGERGRVVGRCAGIVSWLDPGAPVKGYAEWLMAQVRDGVPIAIFGAPGFALDGPEARDLGVALVRADPKRKPSTFASPIAYRDQLIGFEAEPPAQALQSAALAFSGNGVTAHLQVRDLRGRVGTAIATTRFGGVALSHAFVSRGLHSERAWVLNPFAFLARALRLPLAPMPDLSTEHGRRVATFVVYADGLGERARLRGRPKIWSVLNREILARYRLPHAIEAASDSDSRTFARDDAAIKRLERASRSNDLRLTELNTGELFPGRTALRLERSSLTELAPMAIAHRSGLRVLSPTAPDSVYIGDSRESYPYERVLETFERTETPRRLTPLSLHYHAYSAASPGGLNSLHRIYRWVVAHQVYPLRADQYAARVRAFRDQVVTRDLEGGFRFFGGELQSTVRVPKVLGALDFTASRSVVSESTLPQGRYIGFAAAGERRLILSDDSADSPTQPTRPRLEQSNGRVVHFKLLSETNDSIAIAFRISGDSALEFAIKGLLPNHNCRISSRVLRRSPQPASLTRVDAKGVATFRLPVTDTGAARLRCQSKLEAL